jgi:branched-chain amino acid transport system ATP-binding protein
MSTPLLELRNVSAAYGKIKAVKDVSLTVHEGEVVTIIGANGAGKTSTLMTVCGILRPTSGEIFYRGAPIHHVPADKLPGMGLCQVPEGRRIFPRLTVQDNLEMGAFFRKDPDGIKKDMDWVFSLFSVLKERRKQLGGTLSGGEQQMLAIGRALMGRPRLLLLDEPSMGLAPLIVQLIFETIGEINKTQGVTILLVEQNANLALHLATRGYVLETGRVVMEDECQALLHNPEIRKAYLGE